MRRAWTRGDAYTTSLSNHRVRWLHWGELGPEYRGAIKELYEICGHGESQSPVNINTDATVGAAFNASATHLDLVDLFKPNPAVTFNPTQVHVPRLL